MAYRESSEAHRRSAERVAELERELIVTREAVDNLKAEKSVLLEQVRFDALTIKTMARQLFVRGEVWHGDIFRSGNNAEHTRLSAVSCWLHNLEWYVLYCCLHAISPSDEYGHGGSPGA